MIQIGFIQIDNYLSKLVEAGSYYEEVPEATARWPNPPHQTVLETLLLMKVGCVIIPPVSSVL